MSNTVDTAKNSAGLKHAPKQLDRLASVEIDSLKNELNLVKKALEDQQTIIKTLDGELKTKAKSLDDEENPIESLQQTISDYTSKF
jgi:hypothetical protein